MDTRNGPLIQVLKNDLFRQHEKIERARLEIIKLKLELQELGVEVAYEGDMFWNERECKEALCSLNPEH